MTTRPKTKLILAATALILCAGGAALNAQDRPERQDRPDRQNFDPAQMRQRMMERYREQLEVTDDAEWKLIEGRIEKVITARMEVGGGGFFGRRGGPGGPGGQGGGGQGGDNTQRRPRGFGADASPEGEALQKAIEAKAPADEVKSKLAKLRESRKAKEVQLEKAQEDLRKVLSVRQEAQAVLAGLLK